MFSGGGMEGQSGAKTSSLGCCLSQQLRAHVRAENILTPIVSGKRGMSPVKGMSVCLYSA